MERKKETERKERREVRGEGCGKKERKGEKREAVRRVSLPPSPPLSRGEEREICERAAREERGGDLAVAPSMDEAEERDPRGREDNDLSSRRAQSPLMLSALSSPEPSPDPPLLKFLAAPLRRWRSTPPLPPPLCSSLLPPSRTAAAIAPLIAVARSAVVRASVRVLPPENTSAATEICRRRRCRSSSRRRRSRWLPELSPNRFSDRRCFIFLVRVVL
ncbi:uncharacterized protein DS421_19g642480 [Arachis hypogaea]|uniref:Uncharacterized protein n=1 Tax=Arachis hypogaea TaxID=3818 RepID=A0A6B9V4M1_ARAHY|nr:uncharacterized protein DS421_19g642480 [Arachis hypogaea]